MNRIPGMILVLLFMVQLAVPASMIAARELTLRKGELFRFRTAPVDPYDPFRGRYVALNLEASRAPKPDNVEFDHRQKVFVLLGVDENGFATIREIFTERPEQGAYLKARVAYVTKDQVQLQLPFDRYYADERLAPEIERAYRANSIQEKQKAFIAVRVRQGQGVLEELYIDDLPVREYLRRQANVHSEQ